MIAILGALIMGLLGGPVLALAIRSPANQRGYAMRKAKFEAGNGPDPDLSPFGPHKSFKQNAIMFGIIFGALGFFLGLMA